MNKTHDKHKDVEAFVLREDAQGANNTLYATLRSSHASWFIANIFKGEVVYRHSSDRCHDSGYVWVYSPRHNGALGGFGWILQGQIRHQKGDPKVPHFDHQTRHRLHYPTSLRGRSFITAHADHPYPPEGSGGPTGEITIPKNKQVIFYANQKHGRPLDVHPEKTYVTSEDKIKLRYVVKHSDKRLLAVDFLRKGFRGHDHPMKGDGVWGFILQQKIHGHYNFTYKMD